MADKYEKMEQFADILEDVVKDLKPNAKFHWRKMFGGAGYYADDVMFAGWYNADSIGLKLSETDHAELIAMDGAEQGMGKNTVNVPRAMLDDKALLKTWVQKSLTYAESRPKKKKKK